MQPLKNVGLNFDTVHLLVKDEFNKSKNIETAVTNVTKNLLRNYPFPLLQTLQYEVKQNRPKPAQLSELLTHGISMQIILSLKPIQEAG